MNTLENRVRVAARAAADTVADGGAPPLVLPEEVRQRGTWPVWGGGRHPWLVALAAAAAVIAVVAGSIFAAHAVVPGTRRPAPGPPAAPLPHLSDGLPAYFIEGPMTYPLVGRNGHLVIPSQFRSHTTLRVVTTATGKVAAAATMPGYVTATAASRGAFFAAVDRDNLTRFYEIRLTASRAGTTVTDLPIPAETASVLVIAASPDGTKLAFSTPVVHGVSVSVPNLVVASTTEGSERKWTAPTSYSKGSVGAMNWLADSRTLAFSWSDSPVGPDESLRLLDTAAPGSDLLADRAVLPSVTGNGMLETDPMLSPNGRVMAGVASGSSTSRAPFGSVEVFSTATGKRTVLFRATPNGDHQSGCDSPPLWISNTGSELLVACSHEVKARPMADSVANIMLINHGHATWLPWLAAAAVITAFPAVTAAGR